MWKHHHRASGDVRPLAHAHGNRLKPVSGPKALQRLKRLLLTACLLPAFVLGAHSGAAHAQGRLLAKNLYVKSFGPANPPIGFLEFCDRYPEECRPLGKPSTFVIRLDKTRWDLVRQVNLYVNRRIRAMTDQEIYNRPEVWEYPTSGKGDCEDFVLLKKRYLEALGFPSEALLITVVLDENGGGHAVLLVRTDRGDFALDNRRNSILPWNRTGYTYLLRQSQRHPGRWVALSPDPGAGPRAYGNN